MTDADTDADHPTPRSFDTDQWLRLLLALAGIGAVVLLLIPSVPMTVRCGVFVGACAMILAAKKLRPSLSRSAPAEVVVDQRGVRRLRGGTAFEQVRWEELVKVAIMTTDEGPFAEDFFWMLHGEGGTGCLVPQEKACELDLLSTLQRLPGFDNLAVVCASGSTEWAEFICWEGAPGDASSLASVLA